MKPHNYREALQKRSIKPSSDSWEKLNRNLTAHENKGKGRNWLVFKVASIIIIFVSIGFYFIEKNDDMINTPAIVSPSFKEKLNTTPKADDVNQTEIAVAPEVPAIKNETIIDSIMAESSNVEIVFNEPTEIMTNSSNKVFETVVLDSLSETSLISETPISDQQLIDDEVEELLNKSKIKLIVTGQISTNKVVDANALLNSVEDDLYKDLKQKLIEKITNKLKNPKDVVTSREN